MNGAGRLLRGDGADGNMGSLTWEGEAIRGEGAVKIGGKIIGGNEPCRGLESTFLVFSGPGIFVVYVSGGYLREWAG